VWQIAKYGISGVTGGVIQIGFLYVFVDRLHMWYLYGVIASYSISLIVSFSLQKFWTFQDYSTDGFHRQSSSYIVIALGALVLNIMFMYVLVSVFHFWHIVAQGIVVGIVGTSTFLLNKTFTFDTKKFRSALDVV
jgi:dolichol-phosphate mannosyltransferase